MVEPNAAIGRQADFSCRIKSVLLTYFRKPVTRQDQGGSLYLSSKGDGKTAFAKD